MYIYREATEDDYEGICNLVKSEHELFRVYPNGTYPLTISQLKHLSRIRIELTVVTDENKIIGFANLYNYETEKQAFVGNVVIDETYRGKGLGKKLVSYMIEKAFAKYALPEVHISVFSDNIPALLLYAGFGFIPYDIEEKTEPNGNRAALIHMKKSKQG